LLFAFFVILFSLSSSDPAGLVEGGGDEAGAVKQEEEIEEIEKQAQELKEQGVTEIDDKPIEEYMDSLIQEIKEESEPVPKKFEMHGDLAEIIEEMELDSSEATVDTKDVNGMVIELNGSICFDAGKASLKPKLLEFLDAAVSKNSNNFGFKEAFPASKQILPLSSITIPLTSLVSTVASDESNSISSIISAKSPCISNFFGTGSDSSFISCIRLSIYSSIGLSSISVTPCSFNS
jgi:hypothetical protein